jgi:hypothetical protein
MFKSDFNPYNSTGEQHSSVRRWRTTDSIIQSSAFGYLCLRGETIMCCLGEIRPHRRADRHRRLTTCAKREWCIGYSPSSKVKQHTRTRWVVGGCRVAGYTNIALHVLQKLLVSIHIYSVYCWHDYRCNAQCWVCFFFFFKTYQTRGERYAINFFLIVLRSFNDLFHHNHLLWTCCVYGIQILLI